MKNKTLVSILNYNNFEETIKMIEETQPDQLFVSNFIPYPGTRVGNTPKQYGIKILSKDFTQYFPVDKTGTGEIVFSTEDANEERVSSLIKRLRTFTDSYAFRGEMQDYEQAMKK